MNIRESINRIFSVQEGKVEVGGSNDWNVSDDSPIISFERCIYYYQHDPRIKLAVDSYTELIMGVDFTISSNDEAATEIIENFNENANVHMKVKGAVTTMLSCGEALIEKYSESDNPIGGIDEVDITTLSAKPRDRYGNVLKYVQTIKEEDIELTPLSKFINLQLNPTSRETWAKPLAYPLLAPRSLESGYDKSLKAPIEAIWEIEDNMRTIFNRYAEPEEVYTFEGASKEFLKKMKQKFKERKRGEKIFTDRSFVKEVQEVNPQSKFDKYVEHLDQMIDLGTQFSPQIFSAEFTARASSETTESVIAKKVRAIQKSIFWKLKKELYFPILQANGYDDASKLNALELTISVQSPEIVTVSIPDALAAYTSGAISKEEYRRILKKNGIDLDDEQAEDPQSEAYRNISEWLTKGKK